MNHTHNPSPLPYCRYTLLLTLLAGFCLSGCGGGGGSDDDSDSSENITESTDDNSSQSNSAPVADAGADQYTFVGASVNLDGSASSDANGDTLTYSWTLSEQPSGSSVTLGNAGSATPSLVPDMAGSYRINLEVNDGQAMSNIDEITVTAADWLLNTSTRSTYITDGGTGILVNVQDMQTSSDGGINYVTVFSTGIPDYSVTLTQDDIDDLNARPNAGSDFVVGATSASAGDVIAFGQDIGYKKAGPGCDLGYWPPGPACPSDQNNQLKLPAEPGPAASDNCSTSINTIGLMLNGTAVFNWDDGQSYNSQNVWNNLAPVFEQYDVDICQGHAQQEGNYHHHMYSGCVQELLGDDGTAHSPLYGFAADGYPIYGPYYMQGILAKSSWVKRDYSADSESGCGADGVRSCQLADQYDLSKGTTSVSSGPGTSDTVSTQSGNSINAVSGIYFEDYYYDANLAAQGGEYLDDHNGHDHDDLGYHYHITAELVADKLQPVFPYQVGPTFYGELPADSFATCGG